MGVSEKSSRPELTRVLRLWDSVAVIAGIIIGSGIFFAPTSVARDINDAGVILLVWALGGVTALCGALTYAELASTWPKTGGTYVYLRECYSPLWSFLFGWANLWIIRPAAVAGISVIFAQYVAYFVPVPAVGIKLIAVSAIVLVSMINYLGVRLTSVILKVLTSIKVMVLIAIAIAGLLIFHAPASAPWTFMPAHFSWAYLSILGAALVQVYWTYDGWTEITNVAGEVLEPARTIPRALLIGAMGIMVIYVLVNASYLNVLTVSGIQASHRVASDAMIAVVGPIGGALIAFAVMISTFGALNGTTLTGPRIYFAMAIDGDFFSWARRVHPVYRSPTTAIALQAILAVPLVVTWTFEKLTTYFVFESLIFYSLGTFAVFVLRRRSGAPKTTYRTWGYPWTPAIFLVFAVGILINTIITAPVQAVLGVLILATGVPVYFWRKRSRRSEAMG